ncbi:hypothetical protein Lal_00046750 [Lupinus albus]|nr:hypothetical protein Lal_00046750 [Lupinus albus]
MKMAPYLVRLYEQMPEPKYVIAIGACTIIGRMFSTDSYSTVRGVDKLIPVDVYLSGCPPKPEAVIDAITKLHKKISREIYEEQIRCSVSLFPLRPKLNLCSRNSCAYTDKEFRTGEVRHANLPWMIHISGSGADEHIELSMWLRALIVQAQRRNYQGHTLPLS